MPTTVSINSGLPRRVGRVCAAVVVLVCLALGAAVAGSPTATAQPAPTPTPSPTPPSPQPPLPLPPVQGCPPSSPLPTCGQLPQSNPPLKPSPTPGPGPCTGEGCIPQPTSTAPPPSTPDTAPGDGQGSDQSSSCGITNIPACVSDAIESFFRDLVAPGLNGLLDLFAKYVLVTPPLDQVPVMGQIWGSSQQIVVAVYALLVLVAGVIVMAHETLQTRHSIKEVLPRVIVGFLAANLSLFFGGKAIEIANALSQAILGDQVNPDTAAQAMKTTLMGSLNNNQGGMLIIFTALALLIMIVVVLLTYIVRITLTVILLAGAPLLLMCHALPQTEGIAFWWWKAFGGVLAIQVGQSLALVAAIKLFFWPGGITLFN